MAEGCFIPQFYSNENEARSVLCQQGQTIVYLFTHSFFFSILVYLFLFLQFFSQLLYEAFAEEAETSERDKLMLTLATASSNFYISKAYEPKKIIK